MGLAARDESQYLCQVQYLVSLACCVNYLFCEFFLFLNCIFSFPKNVWVVLVLFVLCACMHTYNFYFLNSTVVHTLFAFSWNLCNPKFVTCHISLTLIVSSVAVSTDMQASTVYTPDLPKTGLIYSSFTKCHHQYTICHIFDSLSNLSLLSSTATSRQLLPMLSFYYSNRTASLTCQYI